MKRPLIRTMIWSVVAATCWPLAAQPAPTEIASPPPALPETAQALTPRNANYDIDVRLDTELRWLQGHEIVEWRNIQDQATDELWFHLYWNAWRNDRSTWMLDSLLGGRRRPPGRIEEGDWGWIEVDDIRLIESDGQTPVDLSGRRRFDSSDDGNPEDRSVLVVSLPRSVEPGESVRVELNWHAQIPRTFARTGFRGDFYFLAQWFPKLGVFEGSGWNCHQFHASTEFFSDYGVYDVRMTVPERFVVGASGRRVERRSDADGTTTHRYVQKDVHDFSWTASPNYVVRESRFEEAGLPPADIRLLIQPEHLAQARRYLEATHYALALYGRWFGPYPYGHVTVVDPAYGSGAGGMEYPTLFTGGTRVFAPRGGGSPESVTIHEAGHQFWYGIVGNNEFENAWMDEGINTFSQIRAMDTAYGGTFMVRRYFPLPGQSRGSNGAIAVPFREIKQASWMRRLDAYRPAATSDAADTPAWRFHPATGRHITYGKTALWLMTLERYLGWDTLQRILSTYFERFRFRHPTPEDFFATANEVSGQDLSWFFDQVYHGSESFDYAIDSVSSIPLEPRGYADGDEGPIFRDRKDSEDENGTRVYRSEVVVRRLGGGRFPVEVRMVFDDGSERHEIWDGSSRWTRYVEERPAKLVSAMVDPERKLMLDIDYTNNSRLLESRASFPANKWSSKWMIMLQDMTTYFAFFI